jgi:hypothetical protein
LNRLEHDIGEAMRGAGVSIWSNQEVHDAAVRVLTAHPPAKLARHAFIEVGGRDTGTAAALMGKSSVGAWEVERLYTADHTIPGEIGVVIVGVW